MLTTIKSQVPKSLLIVVKFLWITYHWHLNIFEFEQNSFDGARYVISYKTFKKTTSFIPFEKKCNTVQKMMKRIWIPSPNWKALICKNCGEKKIVYGLWMAALEKWKAETARVIARPFPLLKISVLKISKNSKEIPVRVHF